MSALPETIITGNQFSHPLVTTKQIEEAGTSVARRVMDLNAYHQVKTYEMKGGGGAANANPRPLVQGDKNTLMMHGFITQHEDVFTQDEQLKIDLTRAFGADIAQMQDFVAEVLASLSPESALTQDQKDKLFEMVTEIIELKNLMNLGGLPEGQARLEALIAETAEKIADLLLDGMDADAMPKAIVDFVHNMLSDVSATYDIPALDEKLARIEAKTDSAAILNEAMAEMIAQLAEILETQDDLSEEDRGEIEALIEQMEKAMENGDPVPQSVIKALESLSENHPHIDMPKGFEAALDGLKTARTDFITVKAHDAKTALTADQMTASTKTDLSAGLRTAAMSMVGAAFGGGEAKASALSASSVVAENTAPTTPVISTPVAETPSTPTQGETPPQQPPTQPQPPADNPPNNPPVGPENPDNPIEPKNLTGGPTPEDPPVAPPTGPTDNPTQPPEGGDPPGAGPEQKPETNDPTKSGGCGDNCKCGEDFQEVTANPDGTINLRLEDGTVLNLSVEEATEKIEKVISEGYGLGDDQWQKLLDKHDGDAIEAYKYVKEQSAQEARLAERYVEDNRIDYSNVESLFGSAPSSQGTGEQGDDTTLTDIFKHECDENCDHQIADTNDNALDDMDFSDWGNDTVSSHPKNKL